MNRALFSWLALAGALAIAVPADADLPVRRVLRAQALARAGRTFKKSTRGPLGHGDMAHGGRIPLLVALPAGVRAEDRGLLEVAPGIATVQLRPAELESFLAANPDLSPVTGPPREKLLNVSHALVHNRELTQATGFDGTGVVIGVIDTGLDVVHADFRDENGKTRVAWLIEKAPPRGVHTALELQFGCTSADQSPCAVYDAADIDGLIADDPDHAPRDRDGHGTHVTSIAAGNGGVSVTKYPAYVGMAPKATLVIASPSGGGGFSDPDILNAARFIFDRAEALGMPAVVNVSLGSDFGPHDGTSLLERGLAEMVGADHPGRVIVVAAGNSGSLLRVNEEGPFGVHSEAHVSPNATTRVVMQTPNATGDIDGGGFVWVTFRPGDDVSVGLEGPDGANWIGLVDPGDEAGYEGDDVTAGVINNLVNEKSTLTEETNGAVVFFEGKWDGSGDLAVLLEGRGDAQLWVVPTGGARAGEGSVGLNFARALRGGTITVPGSHPDLIAVGCTLNRISWKPLYDQNSVIEISSFGGQESPVPDSTCYFSAAGPLPDGGLKPDILAPGGLVAAAMSRDADPLANPESIFIASGCPDPGQPCFVVDQTHAITSGTSMAAPHVAGSVALLLQGNPNLTQGEVMEALQAGARRPAGVVPYDYQQGAGALDIVGAQAVLDGTLSHAGPDLAQSYYVLSSPYARPDPSWRVRGTIELRDQDGGIVDGVAAGRVGVRLAGADLVDHVARVRAGLYRFSFAAPFGSGGTTMTVEVLVDGQSLGVRTLPVGVDAWAAGSGVKPVGGCDCMAAPGAAPEQTGSTHAWWLLVALALSRLRATGDTARDSNRGAAHYRHRRRRR